MFVDESIADTLGSNKLFSDASTVWNRSHPEL